MGWAPILRPIREGIEYAPMVPAMPCRVSSPHLCASPRHLRGSLMGLYALVCHRQGLGYGMYPVDALDGLRGCFRGCFRG